MHARKGNKKHKYNLRLYAIQSRGMQLVSGRETDAGTPEKLKRSTLTLG